MTIAALSQNLTHPAARPPAALPAPVLKKIDQASQSFEGMFTSQMMQFMWTDAGTDQTFGGGHAEDMWRGMMTQEMGKIAGQHGGLGIADQVRAEMIKLQQAQMPASPTTPASQTVESAQ